MKKRLAAVMAASSALLLTATPASASHEGSVYEGTLAELNGSGGSGSATVTIADDGETMTIDLSATGLNLDGPHAMHLHGIVEGDDVLASSCPTMADDTDGDGTLTVLEGAPKYGGVQVSLTTEGDTTPGSALAVDRFPAGTSIDYSRAEIPIPDALKPNVGMLHVVVHGIDENGNGELDLDQEERSSLDDELPREATAPALCGTLAIQATGPVQTGAGGLVDDTPDGDLDGVGGATLPAAAGLAAVAVGALTVGAARRRPATVR